MSSLSLSPAIVAAKNTSATSDPRVLDLVHSWLETCKTSPNHSVCNQGMQPTPYPSRLIDVRPDSAADDSWRLAEREAEGITGPYLTLSHRWGPQTLKLEHGTQTDMLRGMPDSVLPGTYQDAVRVVRRLDVRYLWIDSMCIASHPLTPLVRRADIPARHLPGRTT